MFYGRTLLIHTEFLNPLVYIKSLEITKLTDVWFSLDSNTV